MTETCNLILAYAIMLFALIGFLVVIFKIIQFIIWIENVGNALIKKYKNKQQP